METTTERAAETRQGVWVNLALCMLGLLTLANIGLTTGSIVMARQPVKVIECERLRIVHPDGGEITLTAEGLQVKNDLGMSLQRQFISPLRGKAGAK